MNWVAIVPLKQGREQKTRLSSVLSAEERATLMGRLSRHVLAQLAASAEISRIILLCGHRPPDCAVEWRRDLGRGLNAELEALRKDLPNDDILIVHADLPRITRSDISRLACAAKRSGVALAQDRHGTGTNAVGLASGEPFQFSFGKDSFSHHYKLAPHAAVILRRGLALDIDTSDDLGQWRSGSKSRRLPTSRTDSRLVR